jgi:hypothetical protein
MTNDEGTTKFEIQMSGSANVPKGSTRDKAFLSNDCSGSAGVEVKARELRIEAQELHLIFSRIWKGRQNE